MASNRQLPGVILSEHTGRGDRLLPGTLHINSFGKIAKTRVELVPVFQAQIGEESQMPNVCDGVSTSASGTFSWTNNFNRKVRIENAGTSWPLTQQPPIRIDAGKSVAETVLNNATPNDYPYIVYFDDAINGPACPQEANPKIVIQPSKKKY